MAQTALTSYSSSSSSSTPQRLKYDVFLSFRGEDTRNNFTSHLNHALRQRGIQTFIDNQLIRGEEISPSLITAIQESKISVVIFSKNYASSAWCLDELVMILDCRESFGQLVWPIFLNVEPSHVRNQTGSFGDALLLYEAPRDSNTSSKHKERLPKWKIALRKAGNLSGWHLNKGDESELIQRIVYATLSKLNRTPLYVAKHPVGIDAYVQSLESLANVGANDVRVIGIHGTGGIGKTTVAKAFFNKFADDFEGSSFLANVRETSQQYCGLVQLQQTLLSEMLGVHLRVGNTHRGINIIRYRLCHKSVLLVLDDVDQLNQLEALAGEHAWFGPGSRVIITTRNKHFLTTYRVDATYEVKGLNYDEALELLSWNAFKENKPVEGYHELSQCVVEYANGLPLAIVVSGSFLSGRSKLEWKSAIKDIGRKPHKQVYGILKISFDALQDNEKTIFLDIACFFVGKDRDYVIKALECFNLCPTIGIEVLRDMSLITIESGRVQMHNLIQEVGCEIIRQESPEVGKRSRLWLAEDVFPVFSENMGTNAIEGIKLDLPEQKTLYLSSKAFKKMKRLRLLIFRNVVLSTTIEYLPTELRFIDWPGYPFPTLSLNPGPKQLVILNMPNSQIHQLGEAFKNFESLKAVNLSSSKFLTEIPDLSTAPKLESLYLRQCTNLVEIHESVGSLNRLGALDLKFCDKLQILPSSLHSKYLGTLNLTSCFSIEKFPNINIEMEFLYKLCLSGTAIKELPSSIDKLVRLKFLDLAFCEKLDRIPNSIYSLHQLEFFDLHGCLNLFKFPKNMSFSNRKEWLLVDPDDSLNLPFQKLKSLILENCNLLEADFLLAPNGFDNLERLLLGGNKFVSLPSFERFHQLHRLLLDNCESLTKIPELPGNLMLLDASDCKSLLDTNDNLMDKIKRNKHIEIKVIHPGRHIPHWFTKTREGDSVSLVLDSKGLKSTAGVIICAVFKLYCKQVILTVDFKTNDPCSSQKLLRYINSVKPGHMCLLYLPVRFICSLHAFFKYEKVISMCGVHVIWDEDENKLACLPPPSLYSASNDKRKGLCCMHTQEQNKVIAKKQKK
nr:disease resistance protein RUN1-like isoform X1 [Ziziphus jujuba var. spinosa]XP_048330222.1 disease resistance protein RUN1-like isoform X1 [Ziziphus jujuba var. spinosa]XP_048330223.1 disease resistance protein RUN1-like isoform X1 [Ziziphus jujuba var. spinosa]XP_048330224.1 disease resistance protein RUN1-like isoform X1 [Ziziphus jujuba var. spinosa]XP_048330225.1 disease resistance protein RUN1-like isoform X1 [Ziziphus jujuba var. spinosa]XP_048330226.1 disease resistance protein RUN